MTGIDYSDTTPDIAFTYDRLGRQKTVTDAVGTRTFSYNDSLQLETEEMNGLISETITRSYETTGMPGRSSGLSLASDYSVSYGYDTTGRFNSVGWTVAGQTSNVTYGYVPNSDLTSSLTSDSGLLTSYSYEAKRNLRTQVENAFNAQVISNYQYEYDSLGRRTSVVNSGQAFSQSAFNQYGYNDRSELTSSNRYLGTDTADTSNPVQEENRSYIYDSIGNRESATGWDAQAAVQTQIDYDPNPLNQYTKITTDNGQPSTDNLTYDDDGNLTSAVLAGSARSLTYNAENRLIAVEPETPAEGDTKVECVYDYMGRRIQKKVYTYQSDSWLLTSDSLFLYDGWNLVKELTNENSQLETRYYLWGLDLSGSLQGAGGIGGLLSSIQDHGSSIQYYCYDGNGNVGQLISAADGSIAGHYEYDPYGNAILADGTEAENNSFRFSTKYFDAETRLLYYEYRYYSPKLGRWLNREPIEERGEINLYAFVVNNPPDYFDPDGLTQKSFVEIYADFHVDPDFERRVEDLKRRRENFEGEFKETYHGWEIHFIGGYGRFTLRCCDGCRKRKHKYEKYCLGAAFEASGSAGLVSNTNGEPCKTPPEKLLGGELGFDVFVGPEAAAAVDMAGEQGLSVSRGGSGGLGIGVKATACFYRLIDSEITNENCSLGD